MNLAEGNGKLGPLTPGQRWTVARKREVALRLLRGESAEMLSRELGVEIYRLERWRDKALSGIDAVLRERDHFVNQVRFWGLESSYAFLDQPQTNAVAERFNRTVKEQIVHGRVFRDLEEVRAALRAFVELYNRECLLSISSWTSTERNTELPMLLVCKVVKRDGRYQGVSMVGFRGS